MRIALTGGSGILGSSIKKHCDTHSIYCCSLTREDFQEKSSNNTLISILQKKEISIFIHCAANTNVERCEEFPDQCFEDNYFLTERLGNTCKSLSIKFIFISSTGIYGDLKKEPYCEHDEISPTTVHHKSKALAEKSLLSLGLDCLIIRTGWLFGGDWGASKNFVANRIREAKEISKPIKSDISQFGCPTYVEDVACTIFDLLKCNQNGIFNCINEGSASRYDYVSEIYKLSKLNIDLVPVDSQAFNRKANVARNEMAINHRLNEISLNNMPYWKKSLADYLYLNKEHFL
jgi:dTDP-4-dehydrorhamnose reductase